MLSSNGFRDADTKSEFSVHLPPPFLRRAENMTIERKARDTSVRSDERGSRVQNKQTEKQRDETK